MSTVFQDSAPSYTYDGGKRARLFQKVRLGGRVMVVTEENVQKVEKLVLADRRTKLWQVAEGLQLSKGRAGEILHEHLIIKKISVRWVS